jgi:FkbM family methyltransferase
MDPNLINLAMRSLILNENVGPVQLNCAAISDKSGESVSFSPYQEGNPSTNQLNRQTSDNQGHTQLRVATITIDDYCARNLVSPDLIKMDIEGAEAFAVSGMSQTLTQNRPILILEIHPKQILRYDHTAEQLIESILVHGYDSWVVKAYRRETRTEHPILTRLDLCQLPNGKPSVLLFKPA